MKNYEFIMMNSEVKTGGILMNPLEPMGRRAKAAARALLAAGPRKNAALLAAAALLEQETAAVLAANREDLSAARAAGTPPAMLDRLALDESRLRGMAAALRDVAAQEDPTGRVLEGGTRPNGLRIEKISVPLGVVGIIYEARPNVTADAAALCLKAGNAVILRGGREALHSNRALAALFRRALEQSGLPEDCVQFVDNPSRESAAWLMSLDGYLDALIPRGGAGLIRSVAEQAHVPVIVTGTGNCHLYVDHPADLAQAVEIVYNAKTSRPSVCNAAETVLVHRAVAAEFLPRMKSRLDEKHVVLHACPEARAILGAGALPATEDDWGREYLGYELAVRVVPDLDAALEHIAAYSSGHSEAILTKDYAHAERFLREVDSAAVYVNASTRFTDGGEFGLGAEIGISTQKLHARGPMGLRALTTSKYVIRGDGQIR